MFERDPDFGQLKKIWTLKLVIDCGGLKPAATRSKVSVSAVSQSISGLEKSLGRKLVLRKDRKLVPTEYCKEILASIEPAFKVFHAIGGGLQTCALETPNMSWLDFGASESLSAALLPPLSLRLREKLPKLKLTLRVGRSQALTSQVKRGDLCMALVNENDAMKGVSVFPIYEDRLGLYASARHPIAAHGFESIKRFGVATITPEQGAYPMYYSRFVRALGTGFRAQIATDSHDVMYSIARSGTAFAILPTRVALRVPGMLKEIEIPKASRWPDLGKFKVSMVSQTTCDPDEDQFLIAELRSLL